MRYRDPDRSGRRDFTIGPGKQPVESFPHDRDHPGQLSDDVTGLYVGHSVTGVRVLVVDDEPQRGVEFLFATQTRRCPGDPAVERVSLPEAERVEQFLLGREPSVERWTRDSGLRGDLRQAQLGHALATEYLCGRDKQPLTSGGVLLDVIVVPQGRR